MCRRAEKNTASRKKKMFSATDFQNFLFLVELKEVTERLEANSCVFWRDLIVLEVTIIGKNFQEVSLGEEMITRHYS